MSHCKRWTLRPWGSRSVATRPPGPEPATRGQRRTRRSWPSRRGASSPRSIDYAASPRGAVLRANAVGRPPSATPSARRCTSSRRKWLGWSPGIQLMAVQPLASQVGVAPACRTGFLLPSSEARSRASAPSYARPGPVVRTRVHVLASPRFVTGHRPRSTLLDGVSAHDVPDPGREPAGGERRNRAVIPATPSNGPQPDLVLHPAPGAQTLDVLLPLWLDAAPWAGWLPIGRTPRSPRR